MIDGEFRENTHSAEYFSKQDFADDEYEVIWVEFYNKVPTTVSENKKIKVIRLDNSKDTTYHSSYCFNKGIVEARGELLVIPDADQIVKPDFLSKLWIIHSSFDKLVVYPYRYDEPHKGILTSFDVEELEKKCVFKNPGNYGGCLSVRKKWLMEINGYEQHKIFESGFHANGFDIYTRFKNYGLAIMWAPHLKLFHPWHENTLGAAEQYILQAKLTRWRDKTLEYLAINGITKENNCKSFNELSFMKELYKKQTPKNISSSQKLISKIIRKF